MNIPTRPTSLLASSPNLLVKPTEVGYTPKKKDWHQPVYMEAKESKIMCGVMNNLTAWMRADFASWSCEGDSPESVIVLSCCFSLFPFWGKSISLRLLSSSPPSFPVSSLPRKNKKVKIEKKHWAWKYVQIRITGETYLKFLSKNIDRTPTPLTIVSTMKTKTLVSESITVFPWNLKKTKRFPKNKLENKK